MFDRQVHGIFRQKFECTLTGSSGKLQQVQKNKRETRFRRVAQSRNLVTQSHNRVW